MLKEKSEIELQKNNIEILLLLRQKEDTEINLKFNISMNEKEDKINMLQKELQKFHEELGLSTSSLLSLQEKIKIIEEEKNYFEEQKNYLEESIDEKNLFFQKINKDACDRDEKLKRIMDEKEKEILRIEEKLQYSVESYQSIDSRLRTSEDVVKTLQQENNIMQLEIDKLQNDLREAKENFQDEKNYLLSDNENKINLISEKLQIAIEDLESANSTVSLQKQKCFEIEKDKNIISSELMKLRRELDECRLEVSKSEEELNSIMSENENQILNLKQSHGVRLSDVESEMTHCRIEREHLRKRVRKSFSFFFDLFQSLTFKQHNFNKYPSLPSSPHQ